MEWAISWVGIWRAARGCHSGVFGLIHSLVVLSSLETICLHPPPSTVAFLVVQVFYVIDVFLWDPY